MHSNSTFFIFCFLIFFTLGLIVPANAANKQQKQLQLKTLQKKIKTLQNTIAVKQNSKNQYVKQLRKIEKNIGFLNTKIKTSNHSIQTSNKRLKNLQLQKKKLRRTFKNRQSILEKQIYRAYVQGKNPQLQMIFNQQDPVQFQRQLMFYQYIAKQQSDVIQAVNEDLAALKKTRTMIQQEKNQLANTKLLFITQKNALTNDRSKRKKVIANLNAQLKQQGKHLNSLNEDAKQLKQLIASINEIFKNNIQTKQAFKNLRGKLPWPIQGKLKTMYGRLKPLSNLKWQGHIIYANEGEYVRSIASGIIAYADWLKGFGNLIIINHGDDYLSLYSHNQSLFKIPGEQVSKGEIISSAGISGGIKKSGIYFEIRKKGKPQNPSIWCNRKNKFIA